MTLTVIPANAGIQDKQFPAFKNRNFNYNHLNRHPSERWNPGKTIPIL